MSIAARLNSDDVIQRSNRHQHASVAAVSSTTTQCQVKMSCVDFLSIILRAVIMCVLTWFFFLYVALATIFLIHVFLAGCQLRHRRRRRTPPPTRHSHDELSHEDLSHFTKFCYLRRDQASDSNPKCVICLERFRDGARYQILLGYGYAFHSNYIDVWLVKAAVCQICRLSIRLNVGEAALSAYQIWIVKIGWSNGCNYYQIGGYAYNAATYNRNLVKHLISKPPIGTLKLT